MNLRTLKKLSKQAAPLLPLLGDNRKQFPAAHARTGDNFHHAFIGDRKHWDRRTVRAGLEPRNDWTTPRGQSIVYVTRKGHTVLIEHPSHPRKGTIMVGGVSGYYEPEWDEQCAWSALEDALYAHFQDWDADGEDLIQTRSFSGVGDVFRGAREIIAEMASPQSMGTE